MPRSRLVQINENQILLPEDYHVYMPKDYLLVITKLFSTQYAVINIAEPRVLQNTLQRKSIVSTIITVLSWTPEVEKELQKNRKGKRSKKNGNKEPPKITILNFIKKVTVVQQQQQPQTPPQTQQNQQ
jgi:hypothetical protein